MEKRIKVCALALSATGLISIASYEGFRSEAYIPVEGDVPTIGFGSTHGVELGDKITVEEGLRRLALDVNDAESTITRCVKVPLAQREYDVYTSFAFNIGEAQFCSSTLVKKLNAGDYSGACAELKRWVYVKGEKIPGLVNRREAEYKACMGLSDD